MRRLRSVLAAAALAAALTPVTTASAVDQGKGTPGYCPDATGVTVVVDFHELGGDPIIRCAPGEQASGLTALQNAGFELTGSQRWGMASLCRIEGKPAPEAEACVDSPPMTAYWGYWQAPNGGTWGFAQSGVQDSKPPAGSFEGWSFAKDKSFETSPPPRIAPVRPNAPAGTSGVTPEGVAWTGGAVAQPAAQDSGFPWGVVLGGAAVLLVGGAAGVTAYRRKRAS
ncbi:flagellar hook-length control protein FliK [Amycolatopsis albispora]|uniref:Gram-positive cocci surface proteins LPxTG domain-containing protein n=1 Tax=Amycolatopsis albispora TaxID=1804986 RepID=A0A344LEN3_9PSEU|nr:flagellar hook-length control protein FliK [Amycolatopsis albispora]AXB46507.1 hypothetical protein A4R43_31985 [Amycolatopsis albispora]